MRRAFALTVIAALAVSSAASAETWTKYVDGANGTAWSYDADYSYKDRQTGRLGHRGLHAQTHYWPSQATGSDSRPITAVAARRVDVASLSSWPFESSTTR